MSLSSLADDVAEGGWRRCCSSVWSLAVAPPPGLSVEHRLAWTEVPRLGEAEKPGVEEQDTSESEAEYGTRSDPFWNQDRLSEAESFGSREFVAPDLEDGGDGRSDGMGQQHQQQRQLEPSSSAPLGDTDRTVEASPVSRPPTCVAVA